MTNLFSHVLNMSMTGSVVILLVLLVRLLLKRSPKIFSYALWSVVLFRLLCPVSVSTPVSVLEVLEPHVVKTSTEVSMVSYIPATVVSSSAPDAETDQFPTPESHTPAKKESALNMMEYVCRIWAAGVVILMLCSMTEYFKFCRKLVGAMRYQGNVYLADHIDTPFVMGVLSPKIYLPTSIPKEERKFIIAHERHHIFRGDHLIKLISFAVLCIHWFNPLVWAAFLMSGKDMEMSCDEAVIQKMGTQIRADYAAALLRLSTSKKRISGMPLAFGEGDTKGRVLNMSKWKKPKMWVSGICFFLCLIVLVACMGNPEETNELEALNRTTGPATVGIGNLYFTIPDGYSIEMCESDIQPDGELPQYEHRICKGDEIVGGVYKLEYPASNWADYWTWVEHLNVPENVPEERFLMHLEPRGQFQGYPYSMAAFYGKEGVQETAHYFFNADHCVYDLWFSMELLSENEIYKILESAEVVKTSWDGTMRLTLPDDYDFSRDIHGNLIFTDGLNKVGGKCVYKIPEGYQPNEYFSQEFLAALGIPEASNETLGYFGGGSVLGAEGYGIEYFSDVPPGETREVHTHHQFYVMNDGETIYDIWLDLRFVNSTVKDSVLGSVEIPEMEPAPTVAEQANTATQESTTVQWNQQDALTQCRAVLDQVQSSTAYKIDTMQENGAAALNEMSMVTDWGYGGNRLNIAYIPESGGMSVVGGLIMDGQRYSYDLIQKWRKSSDYNWEDPWLVSFHWEDAIVAYMDTLTEESGITVLLRIDKPYAEGADQQPCYFVNFNFEPDGTFRNVYVQVNLFADNAVYKTESILNLNPEVIDREIRVEYNSISR